MKKFSRIVLLICMMALLTAAFGSVSAQDSKLAAVLKMPEQIAGGKPVTVTITNMPPETDTAAHQAWQEKSPVFRRCTPM